MLFVGNVKQYLFETALSIDIFAQYEFRTVFNQILITKSSINKFGKDRRVSVSYVLGKNQINNTLSRFGTLIASFLDWVDKEHCKKAVTLTEIKYPELINL